MYSSLGYSRRCDLVGVISRTDGDPMFKIQYMYKESTVNVEMLLR